jgi:hypothetical protein
VTIISAPCSGARLCGCERARRPQLETGRSRPDPAPHSHGYALILRCRAELKLMNPSRRRQHLNRLHFCKTNPIRRAPPGAEAIDKIFVRRLGIVGGLGLRPDPRRPGDIGAVAAPITLIVQLGLALSHAIGGAIFATCGRSSVRPPIAPALAFLVDRAIEKNFKDARLDLSPKR